MPVGSSSRMLSLLSGGFDSIASSHLLAKRGARVDFMHFHVYTDKEKVMESKIPRIARKLAESTLSRNLIMSSYIPFEMRVLGFDKNSYRYEMVLFRRLMAQIAERYAIENNYSAIIFGDSLGQVASQTMENIAAVADAVRIPIFRPLIGMDKIDIIEFVRKIGLYDEAAADYKDCCSIVSPKPITKAKLATIYSLEEELNMPEIIDQMMEEIEVELV
jgi:thiamine biosynthesis protein ThiI